MGAALAAMSLEDNDADGIILIAHSSTKPSAEPRSHAEAMRDDPEGWGAAELRELENHRKNETFKLINPSTTTGSDARRRRLVPLTRVYKRKRSGILKAMRIRRRAHVEDGRIRLALPETKLEQPGVQAPLPTPACLGHAVDGPLSSPHDDVSVATGGGVPRRRTAVDGFTHFELSL